MSRVDHVERLIQLLSVLRAAEGRPVPRAALQARVTDYASSTADDDSIKRQVDHDMTALEGLGFRIRNVAATGLDAEYVLDPGDWRLPVPLSPAEQTLLVWAMASAAATRREASPGSADLVLGDILPPSPPALDQVQAALAGGRSLIVDIMGEDVRLDPLRLASRQGRWFVLCRREGQSEVKGYRLERLAVVGLGPPMTDDIVVPDVDEVLDPTAWNKHEERHANVRCTEDAFELVASWFPRAKVSDVAGEISLTFPYRNEEALVSRVIGFAGSAWIAAPDSARDALRAQVEAVLA